MRWRGRRLGAVLGVLSAVVTLLGPSDPKPDVPVRSTVVSLTFDDSTADQLEAEQILNKHGLVGTFYVISGYIGTPGNMSRADLHRLVADGQEVGGHSVLHPNLPEVDIAEARREICRDRANLESWGLKPTSFAFPYGAINDTLADIAKGCGYSSARKLGGLASFKGCGNCPIAEGVPPVDRYQIHTPAGIDPSWTLESMIGLVERAQQTGRGWIPLVFHRICNGCSTIGISPEVLDAFAGWLAARKGRGIEVRTVSGVVGTIDEPTPDVPFGEPSDAVPNPSFDAADSTGGPACWTLASTGQNVASMELAPRHHDRQSLTLNVRDYVSGDAKVLPVMDLGSCAPLAEPRHLYRVTATYRSDVPTQFSLYVRDQSGQWSYWTSSPFLDPSAEWRTEGWTTPETPEGTTGLSFGLGLDSNGTLDVDDYDLGPGSGAARFGLWGIAAGALFLVGAWCLLGGRIKRLVVRTWGDKPVARPAEPDEPDEPDPAPADDREAEEAVAPRGR